MPYAQAVGPGRERQALIYLAGVRGRKSTAPTDPRLLEQAARESMSPEAFAYVEGGAGTNLRNADRRRDRLARRAPRGARGVGPEVPVLLDSGIRGGADTFKVLALGARAVLIGRPYAYGLALAGQRGVQAVVRNFVAELDLTMAVAGRASVAGLTPDLLVG
jgi:hypothetical protein